MHTHTVVADGVTMHLTAGFWSFPPSAIHETLPLDPEAEAVPCTRAVSSLSIWCGPRRATGGKKSLPCMLWWDHLGLGRFSPEPLKCPWPEKRGATVGRGKDNGSDTGGVAFLYISGSVLISASPSEHGEARIARSGQPDGLVAPTCGKVKKVQKLVYSEGIAQCLMPAYWN